MMDMLARLDLNLLLIFEAIYAEGGVTRAAARLKLTQPAVSQSLAKLRQGLGDELFVRDGNRLNPTPYARAIFPRIQGGLRDMERALGSGRSFDPTSARRRFTIGLRHAAESACFPRIAEHIRRSAPHVELAAIHFSRGDLAAALLRGDVDAAFDIGCLEDPALASRPVLTDEFTVLMRADHPAVQSPWTLDAYIALDHIVASPQTNAVGAEDVALALLGRARTVKIHCQHAWTACRIVARTHMACTLPSLYAASVCADLPLTLERLPFPVELGALNLYWVHAFETDPAIAWLLEQLASSFEASR